MALSLEAQIKKSIIKAMQFGLGKEVFDTSQERVPVVTGQLKGSGTFEKTTKGFTIIYAAPYAEAVHDGQEKEITKEKFTSAVAEHNRRLASGKTVKVRAHNKNYTGMHPTKTGKGWAILPAKGYRKPNPFVAEPLRERIEKLFSGDLEKWMPKVVRTEKLQS